jgi:hypothetical protein
MYSSLDRVDVVAEKDGHKEYCQTDHRSAAEIGAQRELSVVFALTRILNPKRSAKVGGQEPVVIYVLQEEPPEFFRRAIRAAGGLIEVRRSTRPQPDTDERPPLDEVVSSAFADLARVVATEHGAPLTVEGVATVERALAETAGTREENELAYWSAVVKLGAFAGAVLISLNGGDWRVVETGSLPFSVITTFKGGEATVNLLGKAVKLFEDGPEDSVAALVRMVSSQRTGR